jgi:hypothetical protein
VRIQASDQELGIRINIAATESGVVPALVKHIWLTGRKLNRTLHLAIRRKEIIQRIVCGIQVLNITLTHIARVITNAREIVESVTIYIRHCYYLFIYYRYYRYYRYRFYRLDIID